MIKKLPFYSIVVFALLLQACVSAKLVSNKQEGYTKKLNKIYVIVSGTKKSKSFFNQFSTTLQTKLKEKSVESFVYYRNELSVDSDSEVNARINEYNPQALMLIRQTVVHSTNGMIDGGTFEKSIIDRETKKPEWKAEFEVYGAMGLSNAVETGVKKLCNKLTEDQIIW